MLNRCLAMLLAIMLFLFSTAAFAETLSIQEEESILAEYSEEIGESNRYFEIPLRISVFESAILRKDSIGIKFAPLKSRSVSLGIEALSFMVDLKEISLHLLSGEEVALPAIIQIERDERQGASIILNFTLKAFTSITELISGNSPVVKVSFIQNDNKKYDMTLDELNATLGEVFGGTVEIANQVSAAIEAFWNNLSGGIGEFAADTFGTVETALIDAGDFFSETAVSVGRSVSDAAVVAGDALNGAMEATGSFVKDSVDSAGAAINDAVEATGGFVEEAAGAVTDFWNGLWGN